MFWIGCRRGARLELARWAVSAIFENWPLWFSRIFLLFDTRKSCVFQIFLLIRSIKANLCPNIINFDSVDFSEHRPEEVISFFWRSVYLLYIYSIFILSLGNSVRGKSQTVKYNSCKSNLTCWHVYLHTGRWYFTWCTAGKISLMIEQFMWNIIIIIIINDLAIFWSARVTKS